MTKSPLVTVCVVSYNAKDFITETLDSIKMQTYDNIELIISDDCSKDGTVDVCKKWLADNSERFVSSELVVSPMNTGVTANSNRGLAASHGEWWKIIGSDDILHPECIAKCVAYVSERPEVRFLFGNQITFTGAFLDKKYHREQLPFSHYFFGDRVSAQKQHSIITKLAQVGCAPTSFAETSLLREVGGFNPRFPMNEDTPLYILLTRLGYKLWHLDDYIVYRRVHEQSIMHQKEDNALIGKAMVRYIRGDWAAFIQENSNWFWKRMSAISQFLSEKILENGNDKNNFKCLFWYRISKMINPYRWYVLYARFIEKVMTYCSR